MTRVTRKPARTAARKSTRRTAAAAIKGRDARKTAPRKAAAAIKGRDARKTAPRKAAARKPAKAPVKKAAARKPAARKAKPAARKAVVRVAAARKPMAKKTAARKAVRLAPARKTATRSAAARKTARAVARKPAARKPGRRTAAGRKPGARKAGRKSPSGRGRGAGRSGTGRTTSAPAGAARKSPRQHASPTPARASALRMTADSARRAAPSSNGPRDRRAASSVARVGIVRLAHGLGLPLPAYQTEGAAGLDLLAALPQDQPLTLRPKARALVPTGLVFELPPGTEAQVRPRSGLAMRDGVTVLNSPGTIDCDYRGEVQVLLVNLGGRPVPIARGDRIAQIVVAPVTRATLVEVAAASATKRGAGGFGSTGGAARNAAAGSRRPKSKTVPSGRPASKRSPGGRAKR